MARLEDLPPTAQSIVFDDLAARGTREDGAWNAQTEYEYYFEIVEADRSRVHDALKKAMNLSGYTVVRDNEEQGTVIGSRGMRMAEWGSVAGAYYRNKGSVFQVYIKNAITQDITGSWHENRAKVIANRLCTELLRCRVRISFDQKDAQPSHQP